MKLTYTSLACPAWTIEEAVSAAESYGYAAIEWRLADGAVIGPDAPADVRRRLREVPAAHGVEVACLDSSCRVVQGEPKERAATIEAGQRMLDLAAEVGAPFLRVFGGELPANTTRCHFPYIFGASSSISERGAIAYSTYIRVDYTYHHKYLG